MVERCHRFDDFRHGDVRPRLHRFFRATERGRGIEVEFAILDVGHVRQAAAQRIETNHARIHLREPDGKRVERVFVTLADRVDVFLLQANFVAEQRELGLADAGAGVRGVPVAAGKTQNANDDGKGHSNEAGAPTRQVELPGPAKPLAENYYIHRGGPDRALLELFFEALRVACKNRVFDAQSIIVSVAPLS